MKRIALILAVIAIGVAAAWLAMPPVKPGSTAASDAVDPTPLAETIVADAIAVPAVLEDTAAEDSSESRVFSCHADDLVSVPYDTDGEGADRLKSWRAWRNELAAMVPSSSDADLQAFAGILTDSRNAESKVQRLRQAIDKRPDEAHFHWHMLAACMRMPDCDRLQVERDAAAQAGADGAIWVRIALMRAARQDMDRTVDALRNAIAAPVMSDFLINDIVVIERGLAAIADMTIHQRFNEAMNIASSGKFVGTNLFEICSLDGFRSDALLVACLETAERLESDAMTVINYGFALGVQHKVFDANGDIRNLQLLERKLLSARTDMQARGNADHDVLLATDQRVLTEYFETLVTKGESAAIALVASEVEARRAAPGYDPCLPAIRRAAPATPDQ